MDRLCPCCGKKLTLIPPSREYLSQCMDVSENGVEFQILDLYRLFSYTRVPKANSRYQPVSRKKLFREYSMRTTAYGTAINGSTARDVPEDVMCSPTLRNLIKAGGNRLYRHGVKYQCAECRNILAFDINPNRALIVAWTALIAGVEAAVVLGLLAAAGVIHLFWVSVSFIPAAAIYIFCLIHRIISKNTEKYCNNIVPITEWDDLEELPTLVIASDTLPRRFRRKGNALTTELDGKRFALYITNTEKNALGLYICGINGEQRELIALLNERADHYRIPLLFRGRHIGSAEILQLFELPSSTVDRVDPASAAYLHEWRCSSCGYDNPSSTSECRSCGKYR